MFKLLYIVLCHSPFRPLRRAQFALSTILRLNGELLGPVFPSPAQIVDARFQPFGPTIEMHRRKRIVRGVLNPQIQALALANERPAFRRHIYHMTHWYLPHRLVPLFHIRRQILYVLDATLVRDDVVFQLRIPQTQRNEFAHQILVGEDELPRHRASAVNIAREWLKTLIESEDLRCGCCGHRGKKQRIAHSSGLNLGFHSGPVIAVRGRRYIPQIKLELALGGGGTGEGWIGAELNRQIRAGLHGTIVNRLKNQAIQFAGFVAVVCDF